MLQPIDKIKNLEYDFTMAKMGQKSTF